MMVLHLCVSSTCSSEQGCWVGVQEKMGTPAEEQEEVVRDMVHKYVEGLCWVMAYYYEGTMRAQTFAWLMKHNYTTCVKH